MLRKVEIITVDEELEAVKAWFKKMTEILETKCKFCGSSNVVKNGKSKKGVQNWLCRDCGKAFVDNNSLPRMKSPVNHVASSVYLYYTGSSLNEIRRHIEQQHGILPSDSTIYNWVKRFSKVAVEEADKYTPEVGNTWIADETVLRIGDNKKYWLWDIIDSDSRFLLATYLSPTRGTKDAQNLMERAYKKAGKSPKAVVTDKLASYLDGIELTFGASTKHKQGGPFDIESNTNLIERFHGTLKDRTKVMRGMKTPESARAILDGWLVYYNYFRPHESLKDKTPAEVAKIEFPFRNWADVVLSQAPVPQMIKNRDDSIVISTGFEGAKRLKKIHKRRRSKRYITRMPELTEAKGLRY